MWIDTHLHLEMFESSGAEVIERAKKANVSRMITIGTDLTSSQAAIEIASTDPQIYAAVGIHPHDAAKQPDHALDTLKKLGRAKKVVAIGEIGLDFHYMHSPKEVQLRLFKDQLALAKDVNLPVVIHSRDANEETVEILAQSQVRHGVLHCFTGDLKMARACLDLGFFISFSGIVTFKDAKALRDVAQNVPLDRMLIETDAPYLAPLPYRGKRNEPAWVVYTGEFLARLCGVDVETFAHTINQNANALFGLSIRGI